MAANDDGGNVISGSKLVCSIGYETADLSRDDLRSHVTSFLDSLSSRDDVLLIPPDFTRYHSQAGILTQLVCEHYGIIPSSSSPSSSSLHASPKSAAVVPNITILPALGTHAPMTLREIRTMYGDALADLQEKEGNLFRMHDWRRDVVTIGHVPATMVSKATRGLVSDRPWPAQLNRIVWDKRRSNLPSSGSSNKPPLVLSIGQVVPHEVMGMANFNKNLFVGCGGVEAINLSHFIGAVHGMERMMGKATNPLRDILNYASERFLQTELDLWYMLTVVSPHPEIPDRVCVRGLFIGNDIRCYNAACGLSLKVNFTLLEQPVSRMVTYLDPHEFQSTWLGNKAIYRTRMAMADGGLLIVLAPGVKRFGEDDRVDALIRKYGYRGTPATMRSMRDNIDLRELLSAAAHLIHGSTEGRFRVAYCPGHLTRGEIESVGFEYEDLAAVSQHYNVSALRDGWNVDDEGEFYFIRNPALGLWAVPSRFEADEVPPT
jgi:nickel-dependent lactate racemase